MMRDEIIRELIERVNELSGDINELKTRERALEIAWTPYHDTSTIVGWSSFTIKLIRYKKVGKLVFFSLALEGPSNSTSASITLPPVSANTSVGFFASGRGIDNGVSLTTPIRGFINPNSNVIHFAKDWAGLAWTASGTKSVQVTGWYEAA